MINKQNFMFHGLALFKRTSLLKFKRAYGIFLKKKERPGFTLLEVMVAMGIIAISLVAVFNSQSQSLSLACDAKFSTTAPLLAQKKMAELETENSEDIMSDSGDFGEDFPGYFWKLTVEEPSFDSPENISDYLNQIDLTISWGDDELYSYQLRLYKFSPESW